MPMPRTAQAIASIAAPFAAASNTKPAASTTFESINTPRPPRRSITRPTAGPANAAISNAPEKAAKTQELGTPMLEPIESARIAGK
jgi:hypothetical protein